MADLLNLDVEVVIYDTTSLHFETDEEDIGVGEDDEVRGSRAAGAKTYRAPRKRGKSKNGRGDVPQVRVGLAVTRDGFPVRHWVFPGNTVDVTTVAKVKQDLKGWRLNRCVFVGDAGMVSAQNLHTLARGGGRYIVCMPVHPGGEVDREVVHSAFWTWIESGPHHSTNASLSRFASYPPLARQLVSSFVLLRTVGDARQPILKAFGSISSQDLLGCRVQVARKTTRTRPDGFAADSAEVGDSAGWSL